MTNIKPVFPSAIFTWTDRVDGVSLDMAADINTVASDLISVETTLGVNPQIEPTPPTGIPITYASVSTRVSDAMTNTRLPVCYLFSASQNNNNVSSGILNTYQVNYDPYNMFNGTDLTIPSNGWWSITSEQTWNWWNSGYSRQYLALNGSSNVLCEDFIDWTFSGNVGIAPFVPRWQIYGKRPRTTHVNFQGLLHQGDRISIYSENGTSSATLGLVNLKLKASMLKVVSGTFTSG